MKKAQRIKPPRVPKGEDPKVTVANQNRQIDMLVNRITDLEEQRRAHEKRGDENWQAGKEWREQCHAAERERDKLRADLVAAKSESDYSRGYIARVKECDKQMFSEPFPSSAMN